MANMEGDFCPACLENNKTNFIKYMHINLKEAVLKCESSECMYPFNNFTIKNSEHDTIQTDIRHGNNNLTYSQSAAQPPSQVNTSNGIKSQKITRCLAKIKLKTKSKNDQGVKPKGEQNEPPAKQSLNKFDTRPLDLIRSLRNLK